MLLAALALACASTPRAPPTAFVGVTVLPMDGDLALPDQTVIVEGERIGALGPTTEVRIPASARRIDGRGRWLLPGFTDAHVHLYSRVELPLYLANGVTSVLNLHGHPAHLRWRREIAHGERLGPRIFTTGPSFASPHTPEEAVRLVAEQAAAGYDGVKIYNQVGRAEYPALAAEAKRLGLLFTGHVARAPGFETVLAHGQSIAHAEEYTYSFFNPLEDGDDSHIVYDEARIPEAVRLTREAGITVTPTLSTYRDILRQAEDLAHYLENPELRYLAPWLRATLEPALNRYQNRYSPEELARMHVSFALQKKLVLALARAEVPLLTGSDATCIGPVAGVSIHEELAELVGAGLTPLEALRAATVAPARHLDRSGGSGTLRVGQRADLVLLAADPLADIRHTRRIAGVMAAGRWLDKARLAAEVEAIPAAHLAERDELEALLEGDPREADAFLAARDPMGFLAGAALFHVVTEQGFARFRSLIERLRTSAPESAVAGEEALNGLGYQLLLAGRVSEALDVFRANTEDFPRSANTFDSLGEALAKSGQPDEAVEAYTKALAVDPGYLNAEGARRFLAEHERRTP
jgi:imidazolonepropionase-like amidohydrolase